MESIRGFEWCASINEEFDGLTNMGVVKNGFALAEIRALGITSSILPIILIHDYKYDRMGLINRLKTRGSVSGIGLGCRIHLSEVMILGLLPTPVYLQHLAFSLCSLLPDLH